MGHIAEPKDIDFIIESKPLTKKEKKELADYIKKLKEDDTKREKKKLVKV
jgi:hypothetical protein